MIGMPLSSVIGGPLSGWIMGAFDTGAGLPGRLVAQVLGVAAGQLGDPVPVVVLPEAEAFSAQDRGLDHIEAGFQAAVSLHPHFAAQVIAAQGLVGFSQAQLPRCTRVLDGGQRRCAGATVITGDGDSSAMGRPWL